MIEEAQGTLSALRARSLKTLEEVSRPVHSTTPRLYQCNVLSWRVSMPAFCRNYLGSQPTVHAHSGSHVARRMPNLALFSPLSFPTYCTLPRTIRVRMSHVECRISHFTPLSPWPSRFLYVYRVLPACMSAAVV